MEEKSMMTLRLFSRKFESVPASTTWYLTDLGEARGKQELFTRQSPQRLKALRDRALIESTVSSNRIEGVEVDQSRIATIVFGKPLLRDRDEEEVRGYRQALTLIHEQSAKLPVSEETVLKLHRLTRGDIWDAGKYKEKDGDIIEKFPDGRSRVRFRTVPAVDTPICLKDLAVLYDDAIKEQRIPPLVVLGAFNLDFLCIHPFRDGNGRVSRLRIRQINPIFTGRARRVMVHSEGWRSISPSQEEPWHKKTPFVSRNWSKSAATGTATSPAGRPAG
jgi:Fic family protein